MSPELPQASPPTSGSQQSTQTPASSSTSEPITMSLNSTAVTEKPTTTSNESTKVSSSRTTSQVRGSATANQIIPTNPANNLAHKIGAGVGVPVGCALVIAGLLYLQYHRKKQRQTHEERRRHVENVRHDYISEALRIYNQPQELDTRVRTRPYIKPELSDEARRNIVELSPEYLRELVANRSARASGGLAVEPPPNQGWN
ncbi:MAG: hypothetical protein Q9223_001707 [Gallowayella weberi]